MFYISFKLKPLVRADLNSAAVKNPLLIKILQEEGISNNLCPVCGAQIFPLCPYIDGEIPAHDVERSP